jgi:hypothetical protein
MTNEEARRLGEAHGRQDAAAYLHNGDAVAASEDSAAEAWRCAAEEVAASACIPVGVRDSYCNAFALAAAATCARVATEARER